MADEDKCQYCDKDNAYLFSDLKVCEEHYNKGVSAYIEALVATGDLIVESRDPETGEPLLRLPTKE